MFYFRLARALGKSVKELLATVSSSELTEWMAYQTIEPFDRVGRGDAEICALTANINRDSKRKPEPYVPADFMPHLEREEHIEEFDPEVFSAAFLAATTAPPRG